LAKSKGAPARSLFKFRILITGIHFFEILKTIW